MPKTQNGAISFGLVHIPIELHTAMHRVKGFRSFFIVPHLIAVLSLAALCPDVLRPAGKLQESPLSN